MDAMLIANEAVDSRQKQKKPGILCKLDMEKAYDDVNLEYLLTTMGRLGVGRKWIQWIRHCITTVRFSVLMNGSPVCFFSAERGLRQGDPLSSFLFLLAMEGLNNMIKSTKMKG